MSPSRDWIDTDIDELLSLRNKAVLTGDLNAKYPAWNSHIAHIAGTRLLNLQDKSNFQISVSRRPTHYTPSGNGDVLAIFLHKNVHISDVNVLEILDSDHLSILFHMLDHVSTRDNSASMEITQFGSSFKA
jgi:endonuclease/exonuclease/phosphatase (EEP) superfamily protein YafD